MEGYLSTGWSRGWDEVGARGRYGFCSASARARCSALMRGMGKVAVSAGSVAREGQWDGGSVGRVLEGAEVNDEKFIGC